MNAMTPIKKWHTNTNYSGKELGCNDLPCTIIRDQVYSIWKTDSIVERIKFLFKGEIMLGIHSQPIPPVSVLVGDQILRDSDEGKCKENIQH